MITLRIFLMGLVALVPSRDGKTLAVLLQDARAEHHKHVPVLIYREAQRICTPTPACRVGDGIQIARELRRPEPSPGLFLNGFEIEIQGADSGGLQIVEDTYESKWYHPWLGVVPRVPAARDDFGWVPGMKDIVPESSVVRADLLGQTPRGLAGRLLVKGGVLRSFGLADVQGFIRSLTFKKIDSIGPIRGIKQALADTAVIDLKVCGSEARIILRDFSTGATQTLTLSPDVKTGLVEILLGNLTPLQNKIDPSKPAEHFALYTSLSNTRKAASEIPIPHLGNRLVKKERTIVEDSLPLVIRSVSAVESSPVLRASRHEEKPDEGEAGTDRPICTLVVMSPPN